VVATQEEVSTLADPHSRARARHHAKRIAGAKGERAVRALQRAQCRYAVELARLRTIHGTVDPRMDPVLIHSRQGVLDARDRMAALGIAEALPGTHKVGKALWWALLAVVVVLVVFSALRALGGS